MVNRLHANLAIFLLRSKQRIEFQNNILYLSHDNVELMLRLTASQICLLKRTKILHFYCKGGSCCQRGYPALFLLTESHENNCGVFHILFLFSLLFFFFAEHVLVRYIRHCAWIFQLTFYDFGGHFARVNLWTRQILLILYRWINASCYMTRDQHLFNIKSEVS